MNPLKALCLVALLVATACASPNEKHGSNSVSNSLKPTQWLPVSQLESIPSLDEVTLQQLENMSVEEGAQLLDKFYHLSHINNNLQPSFVPSPSNIPVTIMKPNGRSATTNLNDMVQTIKQQGNFGQQEVTIYITGLPQTCPDVMKANKKLVQAYMQRYYGQQTVDNNNKDYDYGGAQAGERTSSEEKSSEASGNTKSVTGDLVIINLGATINNLKRLVLLDVEQTGNMFGKMLLELADETEVSQDRMHLIGQGIGAHVIGAAGRHVKRQCNRPVRRITALDPSKIYATNPSVLTGLARGDADLVDVIHTSAYGMGTPQRVGDIDFYPNGPSKAVPGAKNVIEASMRAVRYFAESVRPGNERNFPAFAANSLQQYRNNNGNGPLAFMGIDTDYDLEGDYILQVNANSPFGKRAPAKKQNNYHGAHKASQSGNAEDYN